MTTVPAVRISIKTKREDPGFIRVRNRIETNSATAAYNFARRTVKYARIYAPVDTGYMKSQIKWQKLDVGKFIVYVDGSLATEDGAFYAIYVEYGTRYMAAQPFFEPAIQQAKREFKSDMKKVFR